MADYFLFHDREIINRCDDSVVAIRNGKYHFFRRSRGFVPEPLMVSREPDCCDGKGDNAILGVGGDMKNTFCVLKSGKAFLSQHIGSLSTLQGQKAWHDALQNICRLMRIEPRVAAFDLHPQYCGTGLIKGLDISTKIGVQHHHGHMAACMAENGLEGKVTGVILDGTGYGLDGRIWGCEVLSGGYFNFTREYHLQYLPLAGGERAVNNPWITAVSYLITLFDEEGFKIARQLFPDKASEIQTISRMLRVKINTPLTSSCGRLFDAVSALLGLCTVNTYEGRGGILLGEMVPGYIRGSLNPYPFKIREGVMEVKLMLKAVLNDMARGVPPSKIAGRFHDTLITMLAEAVQIVRARRGNNRVVLSGGCWHNRYLLSAFCQLLEEKGFEVYHHTKIPTGDGGISLGQAMVAARKAKAGQD